MLGKYIFGAHAVLLCYDITNYQSFQNVEDWFRLVKQTFATEPLPLLVLVANKCTAVYDSELFIHCTADLQHVRAVKPERHAQFATENEMTSFFVSAKTGDNISI